VQPMNNTVGDAVVGNCSHTENLFVSQLVRVAKVRKDTADTWTLFLQLPEDSAPARIKPGQFNMLYAPGVGEVPISVSGLYGETNGVLAHTIRRVGPVTKALTEVDPGDTLGVRGPFGNGWPMSELAGRDVIVIAGGLGLPRAAQAGFGTSVAKQDSLPPHSFPLRCKNA